MDNNSNGQGQQLVNTPKRPSMDYFHLSPVLMITRNSITVDLTVTIMYYMSLEAKFTWNPREWKVRAYRVNDAFHSMWSIQCGPLGSNWYRAKN